MPAGDNATVRLDYENVVQPDAFLRLEPALGGRSQVTKDDYLAGPPELVVEIAASSASYDMHDKRRVYARNGVQEYLVAQAYEQRVDWFVLREGVYEALQPDAEGVLRSEVFPGLWLPVDALWAGDLATMLAVLQQGLASPEHGAYVAGLGEGWADCWDWRIVVVTCESLLQCSYWARLLNLSTESGESSSVQLIGHAQAFRARRVDMETLGNPALEAIPAQRSGLRCTSDWCYQYDS